MSAISTITPISWTYQVKSRWLFKINSLAMCSLIKKKKYTWPTLVIDLNATIDPKTFLSIYIKLAIDENPTFQVPT
jgi:hypothetical protein